ncbi:MAG TPA: hypothetical protein PLD51_04965 [Pontiellaceae bacterium]|nr:hypothetical protein [Pontiellaceae bacterium]HPR83192.1 hypothetical protein [Pontiellaceae bacterium]
MTENLQQNTEQKGPFSTLQTGCAFVMLTNMLIYLGVVAFTFNLLDPSKMDASYLAKRGFTARPEPEREEDVAFRQLSKEKREEQKALQTGIIATPGQKQEASPAGKLSQIEQRKHSPSSPDEPEKPKAALTQSPRRRVGTTTRSAQSRLYYSPVIYHQANLGQGYSPTRLFVTQILMPQKFETLSVELAPSIDFPTFRLPIADPAGAYLYTPPDPIPEASRGGLKLTAPPVGAESLYTNGTRKAKEPPPAKDEQ